MIPVKDKSKNNYIVLFLEKKKQINLLLLFVVYKYNQNEEN